MVFAEDGVKIPDQFSRVYALRHTSSTRYERVETKQNNSESASLRGPWLHVDTPLLFLFDSLSRLALQHRSLAAVISTGQGRGLDGIAAVSIALRKARAQ
jgi:hypothetical protein